MRGAKTIARYTDFVIYGFVICTFGVLLIYRRYTYRAITFYLRIKYILSII